MARTFNSVVAVLFAAFMIAAVAVDASAALPGTSTRKMLSAGLGAPSEQCLTKCKNTCGANNVCQAASGIGLLNIGLCAGVDACGNLVKVDLAGCCCWCTNKVSIVRDVVKSVTG